METIETYIERIKNQEIVIHLLFEYLNKHPNSALLRKTALRLGPVGFYLAVNKPEPDEARNVFIGPAKPRPLQGTSHPTEAVRRGTVLITLGEKGLHDLDSAKTYDLLMFLAEMTSEEAQEFLQTCLRQTISHYKNEELDPRLAAGLLHVSRICLTPNEPLAKQVQAFFLIDCIKHLNLSEIWTFADEMGDNPLQGSTKDECVRLDLYVNRMLNYAVKKIQELASGFPEVLKYQCQAFKSALKINHERFVEHPNLLWEFLIIAKREHNISLCDRIDESISSYARDYLERWLGQISSGYKVIVIAKLARDFRLWHGVSNEVFEACFLHLAANGGFADAWKFILVTRHSSFLRDIQFPSEDDSEKNSAITKVSEQVQAYVLTKMPDIVAKAFEIGRVDVAYMLSRYYQHELKVTNEDLETLKTLTMAYECDDIVYGTMEELSRMIGTLAFPASKAAQDAETREVEETTP